MGRPRGNLMCMFGMANSFFRRGSVPSKKTLRSILPWVKGVVKSLSPRTRSLSESCVICCETITKMKLALVQYSIFLLLTRPTHHLREYKWKILVRFPVLRMEKNGFEVTCKPGFSPGLGCQHTVTQNNHFK